jgi:acetoin utilization deacetylase AcuC-like enzyme
VRPPDWKPGDAEEVFFRDAFRDALRGTRPANMSGLGKSPAILSGEGPISSPPTVPEGKHWAAIITAETVEDEIKSLTQQVSQTVTTPVKFASQGYLEARRQFSLLGMLFAIACEYDGEIRWQNDAATARDRFLQTAALAKDGTIEVYNAAKNQKTELEQLVRGGSIGAGPSTPPAQWTEMLDRRPLMERLETAQQESLEPKMASAATMQAAAADLIHESELIGAVAHVLTRDGMEDAGDETYIAYCERLKSAARAMINAVKQRDYGAARAAAGGISKSCSDCHETYRG